MEIRGGIRVSVDGCIEEILAGAFQFVFGFEAVEEAGG